MHSLLNTKTQLNTSGEVCPAMPKKTAVFDKNETNGFEALLAGIMPSQQNMPSQQTAEANFRREEPSVLQKSAQAEDARSEFKLADARRDEPSVAVKKDEMHSTSGHSFAALATHIVVSKEPLNTFEHLSFAEHKPRTARPAVREQAAVRTFGDFAAMKSLQQHIALGKPSAAREKDLGAELVPLARRMETVLKNVPQLVLQDAKKFTRLNASEMAILKEGLAELTKTTGRQHDTDASLLTKTKNLRGDTRRNLQHSEKDTAAVHAAFAGLKADAEKSKIKDSTVVLNDVRNNEPIEVAKKSSGNKASLSEHAKTEIAAAQTVAESAKSNTEQNSPQNFSFGKNFDQTVGARPAAASQPAQFKMPFVDEQLQTIINNAKMTVRDARNGSFVMQLHPESLGRVNVNLGLVDGVVAGKFLVDSQDAKDALLASMNQIKEQLENAGISVGEFHVDVRDSGERLYKERKDMLDAFTAAFASSASREESPAAAEYESNARVHDGKFDMVI